MNICSQYVILRGLSVNTATRAAHTHTRASQPTSSLTHKHTSWAISRLAPACDLISFSCYAIGSSLQEVTLFLGFISDTSGCIGAALQCWICVNHKRFAFRGTCGLTVNSQSSVMNQSLFDMWKTPTGINPTGRSYSLRVSNICGTIYFCSNLYTQQPPWVGLCTVSGHSHMIFAFMTIFFQRHRLHNFQSSGVMIQLLQGTLNMSVREWMFRTQGN